MSILDLHTGSRILSEWVNQDLPEGGELDPIIDQLLAELEGSIEVKIENYCRLIRECELNSLARKQEADRIMALSSQDGNLAKNLKSRLHYFFGLQGITKLETKTFKLSVCANGGLQPLEVTGFAEDLPAELQKTTVTHNMDAIREKIKLGETIHGVTVLPRGNHLRIK
jgi:hypothetical protein